MFEAGNERHWKKFISNRNCSLADIFCEIADAFEIAGNVQRRNYFAQVDRKRLALSDDIDALFFDSGLKYIKCGVAVDNLASEFCISLRVSVKCLCDLLLCDH
jgi:hypothetical protein